MDQERMTMNHPAGHRIRLLAVGLLSAAMLAFELTLTRLFALAQFYHFAFMAISLALLGSGAAGSLLSAAPGAGRHPARWTAGFGLAALFSFALFHLVPFDSYAIAWDSRQALYLILTFAGAALPFLGSGLVVGGLLAEEPTRSHQVYAANLAGSALGCVLVMPLLALVGGEGALLISAALGFTAALLFLTECRRNVDRIAGGAAALIAATVLVGLAVLHPGWIEAPLSPYKGLSQALLAPGARHTLSRWNAIARVDVVESESIHIMPGLSLNAQIASPPLQAGLTLDGDNLMPVTALPPDDALAGRLAANVPQVVAAALRPEASSMLILEAGGGWEALMALAGEAPGAVTVIEPNPLVARILRDDYADFTAHLYTDPRLTLVVDEGRTYLRRTRLAYDVILFGLSDSFHPVTSGAYSLSEDYRYTVEALSDALNRLQPDGVLVITRWLQTPPTESLRVLATLDEALRARGIEDPGSHLAAFRTMRTMTFVAGGEPFSPAEQEALRTFCAERAFDLVWLPGIRPDETNRYNRLPEPIYYQAFHDLLTNPGGFIDAYDFDIRPVTDDRPFFFHYFRWRQTPEILATLGMTWQPFGGSGYLVLVALLALVSTLAAALIIGPLMLRRAGSGLHGASPALRWRTLVYFGVLGMGFLFIEIPLAQHFILFLGQPVTALAAVLFAILLFSGLGSLLSPRWRLRSALLILIGATLAAPPALRGVFTLALGWPLGVRIAVSIASLAPLGLLMGMPFARGLALIEAAAPGLTPWAWAVNGCTSVISAVLAVMIAISAGFSAVLWIGAGLYGLALATIWPLEATHPARPA
jgi:hypothetical protein